MIPKKRYAHHMSYLYVIHRLCMSCANIVSFFIIPYSPVYRPNINDLSLLISNTTLNILQGIDQPDKSPVVLLTTNLLKKELRGATVGGNGETMYHAGLAINCLSNIATEDLGRELLPDLLHLLKHPSPYIRKKALLCLYKVFLKYPQGLRLSFDQIKLCLEDSHSSVVSCAVNVITELSDVNPKNYLPLAPAFFKLLTSSANNWMLIKVVKLLGSLVPEEPRLARKLLEPLSNIVKSTHAKSLLYESVYAITLCLQYVNKGKSSSQPSNIEQVVELCVETLRSFVSDPDQNLKYLGLVGFGSLLQSQPNVLHSHSECRTLILKCLSDEDVTIRTRSLGLLKFMATQRNLVDLITQLLGHVEAASGEYKCEVVEEIISLCSSNKYELVLDFAWYVDVLVVLASVRGLDDCQGEAIAKQWMDVAWRVLPVRSYAVRKSLEVLISRGDTAAKEEDSSTDQHIISEVLPAAAWIVGEYSHRLPEALENDKEDIDTQYNSSSKGPYHALIQSMTSPTDAAGINPLPPTTQAVFVQNAMKVFAAACDRNQQSQDINGSGLDNLKCTDEELYACADTLMKNLLVYIESVDVEVKERAFTSYQLLISIGLPSEISALNSTASSIALKCREASSMLTYILIPEPMKPISAKAQKRKLAEGPPSPMSVQDWEKDVNWDVFSFFNEETPWFDKDGNVKGSPEMISFTSQLSNTTIANNKNSSGGAGVTSADGYGMDQQTQSSAAAVGNEATSLSLLGSGGVMDSANLHSSPHQQRQGDPFYLNSSAAVPSGRLLDTSAATGSSTFNADQTSKESTTDAAAAASRFGSIQLDSGDESDDIGVKPQKKKKKKRSKKTVGSTKHQTTIVESDDEDDDNNVPSRSNNKRGIINKDFQNLALVDLTTPLGEDEVMPRNEHYVVPERPNVEQQQVTPKKAKKKKKSKASKTKHTVPQEASAGDKQVEGDLLGFDSMAFGSTTGIASGGGVAKVDTIMGVEAVSAPSPSKVNPINNAFDDLLGLEMPPTIAPPSTVEPSSNVVTQAAEAIPEVKAAKSKSSKKQKKDAKHKKKKKG